MQEFNKLLQWEIEKLLHNYLHGYTTSLISIAFIFISTG